MPFFLGIDGGGSKTRCLVGDEGRLLAAGNSSSCKVQRVGEACARDSLAAAIHEACVGAGTSPRQIARTCAGVTGAARPEIAGIMRGLISSIVGGEVEVVGDVEIGFEDAFGPGPGVIVIAGTGSIAYGRNAQGEIARAGGWGHAISDEGSGHWIGVAAISAAMRASDRGENPTLLKELMPALGATTTEELIVRVNANPPPDFASLFPVILSAAQAPDAGDSIAHQVLEQAGRELAELAETVVRRLFTESDQVHVATHGGVFANSMQVKNSFVDNLRSQCPRATYNSKTIDPALGALECARRGFGSGTTDSL